MSVQISIYVYCITNSDFIHIGLLNMVPLMTEPESKNKQYAYIKCDYKFANPMPSILFHLNMLHTRCKYA